MGEATVADHRANRGSGGSRSLDVPHVLIAACTLCNGLKEDAVGLYRESLIDRGIRVLKAATNRETAHRCELAPVQYPDGRWWLLHPDGSRTPVGP
ncbi:Hypotetical protein [Gulosibacter molinativorax]|nr:Hypotetical protein [Gulosibacter molinativorax]